MARGDEPDWALQQRVHDVDIFFAWHAEDVFDALDFETFHERLGSFHIVPWLLNLNTNWDIESVVE